MVSTIAGLTQEQYTIATVEGSRGGLALKKTRSAARAMGGAMGKRQLEV